MSNWRQGFVQYESPRLMDVEKMLKPCPFCGGPAKVETRWKDGRIDYRVRCRNRRNECDVHPRTPYDYASAELAADAWNRRAE